MKETKALQPEVYAGSNLPVTQTDFEALSEQRKMLLSFVAQQLKKDVDFGVVPGTKKPSLFKPGAEKLARLFGLGSRFTLLDKTIDKQQNFAMFTYKAEILHLKTGQIIAECEASCNSQEKKFKERTVWIERNRRKEPVKEATPIFDILNTLQKMSQKRAFVGAIILAVAASDFFTQDIDDPADAAAVGAAPDVSRDVSNSVPNVTNVSSEPHLVHDSQKNKTILVSVSVPYEDSQFREAVKEHGFSWNKDKKVWTKQTTATERTALPFETQVIG